jgi:hypothetical protein
MTIGKEEAVTQSKVNKPIKRRSRALRLRLRVSGRAERATRSQDLGDVRLQFLLDASNPPR